MVTLTGAAARQAYRRLIRPRTRPTPGAMNQLEQRYAQHLDLLKQPGGPVLDWRYEPFNLRLAANTYYRPDFFVITKDGFELHETKGFMREDAQMKLKIVAEQYWFWFIRLVKWDAKAKTWVVTNYG